MSILWIFGLYIVGIGADNITITAYSFYSIQTFVCNSKNIEINLQFSSDNGNVGFYTLDRCMSSNFYDSLSVSPTFSTFSGALTGTVGGNSVCLQFYNANIIQSTTVTYTINIKCIDSVASDTEFALGSLFSYLIIFGSVILFVVCCACIRYYYNRGIFARMKQPQFLPLQDVIAVPEADVEN